MNIQLSIVNIICLVWSAVQVMAFCDSNNAPTYGVPPIFVIDVGVTSVGRFFTVDETAIPFCSATQIT